MAAHNQLEACLDAFWPGAKATFADVTSEIALAFLERHPTPASAKKSGKHAAVHFRWACDTRLRVALTTFADNSRHASPWAADVYRRAIARGCDHPHAVRVLARAWVRVIYRCWVDGKPYDPATHGGAVRLAEVAASKEAKNLAA